MAGIKFDSKALLIAVFCLIIALLAASPLYTAEYTVILITSILMYVILTVSWTIFSGVTGYVSLATAAFFGIGIYTSAILGKLMPLPVIIIIAGVLSFCVALGIGAVTLRLRGIYFIIFTLGIVELIRQLLLWYEVNITGTRGRFVVLVDNTTIFYVILIIFILLMITSYIIRQSKYGLALQSIGENEEAAAHIGINTTSLKIVTFAISALFMGATGAIMATKWTYIDPFIAFNYPAFSFTPILMAIFGGVGQLWGPVVGAAILAYVQELLITEFPYVYMLIFGVILVIAILFLPGGLVGIVDKWRKGGFKKTNAST